MTVPSHIAITYQPHTTPMDPTPQTPPEPPAAGELSDEQLLQIASAPIYLGDFSATPPWHSRHMTCTSCNVSWTGCWDSFQCPRCGEGDLPCSELERLFEQSPAGEQS